MAARPDGRKYVPHLTRRHGRHAIAERAKAHRTRGAPGVTLLQAHPPHHGLHAGMLRQEEAVHAAGVPQTSQAQF